MAPTRDELLAAVAGSLREVVVEDVVLLALYAHELAIVHRFGVYLEHRLRPLLVPARLSLDMDYNRHGDLEKWLPERPDGDGSARFRPDLVIHERRTDEQNLLVLEWKKSASDETVELLARRIAILVGAGGDANLVGEYAYDLGVIVDSNTHGLRWRAVDATGIVRDWQSVP